MNRQDIIGISATRASAILGLNQWKSPLLAWQEICEKIRPGFNKERGYLLPEYEDKAVFRWGKAFENSIIDLADALKPDGKIGNRENLVSTQSTPAALAFIDGQYSDYALHEGKTTNARAFGMKWGDPGTDRIPQEYQVQVQHSMMCGGMERAIVSLLVFPRPVDEWESEGWSVISRDHGPWFIESEDKKNCILTTFWAATLSQMGYFHQYPVEANPDTQKLLREMYADFWNRYVLTEKEPEVTDYDDIRRVFTSPKGTLVVSADVAEWMREYRNINAEIGKSGHLEKRKDQLKTQILVFAKKETTVADDESQEKIIFMDEAGHKVGQFDGKTFRA